MLTFACPRCRASFELDPAQSGNKFFCDCGQKVQVPPPPAAKTVLGRLDDGVLVTPEPMRRGRRARDYDLDDGLPENRGIAIMVLGIAACFFWFVMLAFWPLVIFALVLGIVAWVLGANDLRRIKDGQLSEQGSGFVLAGYVCGIVATALAGMTLLTCMLVAAFWASVFPALMNRPF
jgi:hypothetical protein